MDKITSELEGKIVFVGGACRNPSQNKINYEGFLSPLVIKCFGEYMQHHSIMEDGTKREADNWQKGIPLQSYMESMFRHFITVWLHHRECGELTDETLKDALCGILFNVQGYLHEILKAEMR